MDRADRAVLVLGLGALLVLALHERCERREPPPLWQGPSQATYDKAARELERLHDAGAWR